jgi:hypothetical protein
MQGSPLTNRIHQLNFSQEHQDRKAEHKVRWSQENRPPQPNGKQSRTGWPVGVHPLLPACVHGVPHSGHTPLSFPFKLYPHFWQWLGGMGRSRQNRSPVGIAVAASSSHSGARISHPLGQLGPCLSIKDLGQRKLSHTLSVRA